MPCTLLSLFVVENDRMANNVCRHCVIIRSKLRKTLCASTRKKKKVLRRNHRQLRPTKKVPFSVSLFFFSFDCSPCGDSSIFSFHIFLPEFQIFPPQNTPPTQQDKNECSPKSAHEHTNPDEAKVKICSATPVLSATSTTARLWMVPLVCHVLPRRKANDPQR